MSESEFDPDDIAELEKTFARIKTDASIGFGVEFVMTKLSARDMVKTWLNAIMGDKDAIRTCMENYSYIVEEIMNALKADDEQNPD